MFSIVKDIWYAPLRGLLTSLLGWHNDGSVPDTGELLAWDDVKVSISLAKRLGNSDPTFEKITDNGAGSTGVYASAFSHTALQEVLFDAQMPHGYKAGTPIKFHLHWAPSTAGAGNVVWGLEVVKSVRGVALGPSTIYLSAATPTPGMVTEVITAIATVPGDNLVESSILVCRLFRTTAGNTYAAKAFALSADFHVQKNKPGTYIEYPTA